MIFPLSYSTNGRNDNLLTLIGEARGGISLTLRLTRQYRSRLYPSAAKVGGILGLVAAVELGSDQALTEVQAELAAVSTCMVVTQGLLEQAPEVAGRRATT